MTKTDFMVGAFCFGFIGLIGTGLVYNKVASPYEVEATATAKFYDEESDSCSMEFVDASGNTYTVDEYICPLGTDATLETDKNGNIVKILTRTYVK